MNIIHFVDRYSETSETFIRNIVLGHDRARPTVLTYQVVNGDEYPFDRVVCIPTPRSKRQFRWWWHRANALIVGRSPWHSAAAQALRAVAPNLIHAHFGNIGYEALPVAKALGIPLAVSFYGYDISVLPKSATWRRRLKVLFAEAAALICEGPAMRDALLALGAPSDRTYIIPIMINRANYPAWSPLADRPAYLFAGRFVEKKGLLLALEAFREIASSSPEVSMRIIGDGPLRPEVEQFIAANSLASRVVLLGMQPHHVLLEEMRKARVLVQPSITASNGDTEGGAPTILLEAQAIGLPIVASTHADIPNILDRSDPGVFLAAEGDLAGLAAGMKAAVQVSQPVNSGFVEVHHDVPQVMSKLENLYARLI